MAKISQEEIKALQTRYRELFDEQSSWRELWKELADNFDSTGYRNPYDEDKNKYRLVNRNIIDTTPILAARTLASGMQGGMTSPAREWFGLRIKGSDDKPSQEIKEFIDDTCKEMRAIFSSSNFYNCMYQAYAQLGIFGSTCVLLEGNQEGFSYSCLAMGTYVFDVDTKGRVDTVIRKIWLNRRQIVQEFGEDVLPYSLKHLHDDVSKYNLKKYAVYHAVYPNKDEKPKAVLPEDKAYRSVYYMDLSDDRGGKCVLRDSGFDSFPYFGVRWSVLAQDTYGKSPALDVLGSARLLQVVRKDTTEGIHKQVNPPVNAPSELESIGVDLSAGGVNFFKASGIGGVGVTPSLQVAIDVNAASIYINDIRTDIQEGMYNDLFRMLLGSQRSQITATEIASKEEEKLVLIGPVIERLQDELFNPLIERTFMLMLKYDLLPPIPESLAGQKFQVDYISSLSLAQKIASLSSVEQFLMFLSNIVQFYPNALDLINFDEVIRNYCDDLGVPASALLSQEVIDAIRQAREQQQQQAQAQQEMLQTAQMAQAMGQTPLGNEQNPNALDAVIGGLGRL